MSVVHRWSVPPLPERPSRRQREQQAAEEAYARHQIKWIWNEVCAGTFMIRRIVPTGTVSWEPPRIGRVRLGPPTTFTVELRPGQLRADFIDIRERLAAAFEVRDVVVTDLVRGWLLVQLVEGCDEMVTPPPPARPPGRDPMINTSPAAPTEIESPHRPGDHLGRRGWRRPFGRPRTDR